jgi:hypothetical protein
MVMVHSNQRLLHTLQFSAQMFPGMFVGGLGAFCNAVWIVCESRVVVMLEI